MGMMLTYRLAMRLEFRAWKRERVAAAPRRSDLSATLKNAALPSFLLFLPFPLRRNPGARGVSSLPPKYRYLARRTRPAR